MEVQSLIVDGYCYGQVKPTHSPTSTRKKLPFIVTSSCQALGWGTWAYLSHSKTKRVLLAQGNLNSVSSLHGNKKLKYQDRVLKREEICSTLVV